MTAILRQADVVPHRFTVAEFLEVAATDAFDGRRIELIEGEIVDMPADGVLHRRWTAGLTVWLAPDARPRPLHAYLQHDARAVRL